jgi:hypothetical protein
MERLLLEHRLAQHRRTDVMFENWLAAVHDAALLTMQERDERPRLSIKAPGAREAGGSTRALGLQSAERHTSSVISVWHVTPRSSGPVWDLGREHGAMSGDGANSVAPPARHTTVPVPCVEGNYEAIVSAIETGRFLDRRCVSFKISAM